jgi:hypothetical protein
VLKDLTSELKKEVTTIYALIFDELEKEAAKWKVIISVYENRDAVLGEISNLKSIAQLKNKKLNADNFKREQIEKIISATPPTGGGGDGGGGDPKAAHYPITKKATTISNENEMEAFLQRAKDDMLKLLRDNKTIILK